MESKSLQPLYIQVADTLKQRIDEGLYPQGSKLPSENQLVESLGVSRVTVRKALGQLADIGYTTSEKGKGTFVAHQKLKHDFLGMAGFAQELQGAGLEAHNQVIHFEKVEADASLASKLSITVGDLVYHCGRLRVVNQQVVSYEDFYIPWALLPDLDAQSLSGSKFAYLKQHDIEMVKTQQKIKPALPSLFIQKQLSVDKLEPILINESINFRTESQPYEYSIVYYKSSVYDFEITARL
ncbi:MULTISPECIES: GntR family transcriptional regulator [Vibrio]|uniref:GntR family transcriptional regulator n=1 Tax=Vibrio TaxID=662 RepID=UPI0004DCEFF0|nr:MULTISPECIES: GntR family transcriptional regulator [Vibrio]KFA98374.1 GntR family transcriptional regulator [Vibrio sp. ER1A]MCY9852140.1 GntR family transcriptional regulator [Vibrio mediterranei]